ncbi:MAG TPA: tetratricopeptide repeat protein, partial [Firmicutes bacterium]|nr:tetratricopeptide repeat protein [Bacillota bacterium]
NNYILNKLRNYRGYVTLRIVLEKILEKGYFRFKERELQLELANTLYRLKEYKNAINVYESIPGYKNQCNNRIKIAEIYINDLGDFESALQLLEGCPVSPSKNYLTGIDKLLSSMPEEAIHDLELSSGAEKNLWLAFAYILKNDREEAIRNFDKYISNRPESDIAGDVLSISRQVEMNLFEESKAEELFIFLFLNNHFKRYSKVDSILLELDVYPKSSYYSEAQIIKARKLRNERRFRDAINILNRIPEIYYRKDYTLFLIGEIYRTDLNNKISAHEYYGKLIMKYPESIWSGRARKIIELMKREEQI